MPLAGLHKGAEALQGSVHAGGAHAKAHWREATQVHGELAGMVHLSLASGTLAFGGPTSVCADTDMASCRALPRYLPAPSSGPVQLAVSGLEPLAAYTLGNGKEPRRMVEVLVGKLAFPWAKWVQLYHRETE